MITWAIVIFANVVVFGWLAALVLAFFASFKEGRWVSWEATDRRPRSSG